MQTLFSTKWGKALGVLTLIMIIVALAAYTKLTWQQADVSGYGPTISVEGTGEVNAVPDVAEFSFSVMAEADTAEEAQSISATSINEIITFLKEQGIEEKDIETQNYNLYPRYRFEEVFCIQGNFCPPGERVQDGFTVDQAVSVKIRNTDNASSIISGVGERGATNISSLNFIVDDEGAFRAEARKAAIADAKEKAVMLADQLGVSLGDLVSFYENNEAYPKYYDTVALEESRGGDTSVNPSLPSGENTTTVIVNLTYEIE